MCTQIPASTRHPRSNQVALHGACALLSLCFFGGMAPAAAQAFDPVVDLFRLNANDRLVINLGGPVNQAGDVNGDGIDDVIVAAGSGSAYVIFGPNRGDNGRLDVLKLNGINGFALNADGPHVSSAGDINGDGLGDVMVGNSEATYVVFGSYNSFSKSVDVASLNGRNGFVVPVNTSSFSEAGDVNGDGVGDIIIGSTSADPNDRTDAGASYIIFGRSGDFPASVTPALLNGLNGYSLQGVLAGEESGYQVANAGDFNNDGLADVLIGAPGARSFNNKLAGKAYVVYGSRSVNKGRLDLATMGAGQMLVFQGRGFEHFTGRAVSSVGDLNRDGVDDVGIGAPGRGPLGEPSVYPGKVIVLFGGRFGSTLPALDENALDGNNGFVLNGIRGGIVPVQEGQPQWGDQAGDSLDLAGDINGDGVDDMVIGAPQSIINPSRAGNGQAYIVYGSSTGFPARVNLAELDGNNGFRLDGIGAGDQVGFSVSRAGDFNADGVDDVLIAATGQGDSYLLYGRNTGADAGPITRIGAPGNLRVALFSNTDLELSWNQPDLPIASYEVSRNAEVVATLSGDKNSFPESGLQAGARYNYTVVAVAANGVRSMPASVTADLPGFVPDSSTPATPTDPDVPVLPTENPGSPSVDAPVGNNLVTTGSLAFPVLILLVGVGAARRRFA